MLITCAAIAETPLPDFNLQIYHFPIDRTVLLPGYRDNAALLNVLDSLLNDPVIYPQIDSILITAAASPIATQSYNKRLSFERASTLRNYLMYKHPRLDRKRIQTRYIGVDWEGFLALVTSDENLPSRDLIAYYLTTMQWGDELLKQLRRTGGRETFDYLVNTIYPELQYAAVRIRLKDGRYIPPEAGSPLKAQIERQTFVDTVRVTVYDTICCQPSTPGVIERKSSGSATPYYMALKNNLLCDAALLPNLAVEFSLGKRWSMAVEGYWAWWNTDAPDWWYYRIQAVGLEFRKWFGDRTPLTGHFVGLYGLAGNYDIRLFTNRKEDIGYLSRSSWSAGLTYGYSLPLSERWNLEFSIGAGYLTGTYQEYNRSLCTECFPWLSTKKLNYWGPTRAGISLVWLIGSGANRKEDAHED
jgi:hypothetical protein